MSLVTKVSDLATRVGTEFKTVRTEIAAAQTAAQTYADALDTDDVAEGSSNLYFTSARAQSALSGLYDPAGSAAAAQAAAQTYADALDTDDVAEGTSNLYFTNARAQSALSGMYDAAGAAAAAQSAAASYTDTAVSNLIDAAPSALNTLNELAAALGDDASFSSTITTALGNRVRIDAAQSFTTGEKSQGRSNIDAASATDVGDTTTNYVTTFEAALV